MPSNNNATNTILLKCGQDSLKLSALRLELGDIKVRKVQIAREMFAIENRLEMRLEAVRAFLTEQEKETK